MIGVFLDQATVHPEDIDFSPLENVLSQWSYYPITASDKEVIDRIKHADVVITNKVVLTDFILSQAKHLKLICIAATGTNNIALETAYNLGIPVCNVPNYCTASVTEHVFTLILALTKRLNPLIQAVVHGAWQKSPHFTLLDFPCRELKGKTLGIIGYGELGKSVARVAQAFGMNILIAQRANSPVQRDRIPLKNLLPQVDILSLHCPLTPDTQGLINKETLGLMRSNALLINTARGGIVDEAALVHALRNGKLGGAGIDVLSQEPPKDNHPLLAPDIPNLILTPHVAWNSREARQNLIYQVADNIQNFLMRAPKNIVNKY
ncbi:2-hydroxyacid dehydrogenase [Candidatus Nitrosacidococcus tergens]|uniref:Glycerate dehydrogenase n=1 Tax=Candidatus Nitrosacidococcus tergens TaxID=553981 RepID=A0A7G1Q8D5_9GAMM|nr:2-hydroxyacid dehydrogenase [Candidatus Nitrosacidococcus tergens]CAB1274940.1 Glycerate dehydrogenase [Candidatus Nitrosacidococcus tergens]